MKFLAALLALTLSAGAANAVSFDLLEKTGQSAGPISAEVIDFGAFLAIEDFGDLSITLDDASALAGDIIYSEPGAGFDGTLQASRFITDGAELLFSVGFDESSLWGTLVLATLELTSANPSGTMVFDDGALLDVTLDAVKPIPLPAAAWLLISGMAALAGVRTMRREQ